LIKITIISVGKRVPDWVQSGFQEYSKRLTHELKLDLAEINAAKRSKNIPTDKLLLQEANSIMKNIPEDHLVIVLDEKGKTQTTRDLADRLKEWTSQGQNICFIIGGPDGLHPTFKGKANDTWSLSKYTLPHALVRVFLIEQIYRAWCILKNHPYHRE